MQISKIKCLANQERMLCLQSYTVNVAQCKSVDSDLRCLSQCKKKKMNRHRFLHSRDVWRANKFDDVQKHVHTHTKPSGMQSAKKPALFQQADNKSMFQIHRVECYWPTVPCSVCKCNFLLVFSA